MADLATNTDGDLVLDSGVRVAENIDRDRHMVLVRIMTVQGDYKPNPELGVSSRSIGKPISGELLQQVEEDVLESILKYFGGAELSPTVRAIPTGPHSVTVMVQIEKEYADTIGSQVVVQGDYWNRDEKITLLDGSEG